MRRWPRWAQRITLLCGSTVLSFVFLEIVLRIVVGFDSTVAGSDAENRPRDNEWVFYEYDPLLGWKNKACAEGFFSISDSRTHVKINSKGLRGDEHSYEKNGKRRILVLGDSFTWGFGVEQADRYTEQVEAMMGPGVEIINAGVSGYGTDQELLWFTQEGMKYHPDIVLLEFGLEDIINNNHALQYSYPKPLYVVKDGQLELTNTPVPRRDARWEERVRSPATTEPQIAESGWKRNKEGAKNFIKGHFVAPTLIVRGFRNLRDRLFPPVRQQDLDLLTRMLLLELRHRVTATGAQFVVVMVPYRWYFHHHDPSWDAWKAFFKSNDFLCDDLEWAFTHARVNPEKLYFRIDTHWDSMGHKMAARAIWEFFSQNGLSKPEKGN